MCIAEQIELKPVGLGSTVAKRVLYSIRAMNPNRMFRLQQELRADGSVYRRIHVMQDSAWVIYARPDSAGRWYIVEGQS